MRKTKDLIKKLIKGIMFWSLVVVLFICIAQYVKEIVFSDPQRISDNLSPRLEHLSYLSIEKRVYDADRPITYSLSYMNLIPLGRVNISAKEIENYILLRADVSVADFINNLYTIKAGVQSLIDKQKFYPYKYVESTKFDVKEKKKEIIFYPNKNMAQREGKKYKIPPMTFCPLSAFYYLQLQDLALYRVHKIKLLSKEEIYVLEARVTQEDGDIVVIEGQVRREDLSSSHGAKFEFYVSKKFRIPLLIKIKTNSGTIIARAI